MIYTKETLKEAIIQKLRLNYGCTEKQAMFTFFCT